MGLADGLSATLGYQVAIANERESIVLTCVENVVPPRWTLHLCGSDKWLDSPGVCTGAETSGTRLTSLR